jgi:GGDEF domain-containing protein
MLALMPHGTCFLWNPWLTALHVIGDMLVALAYFSIPWIIYRNRHYIVEPMRPLVLLFAAFILSCGVGHSIRSWNIWHTNYWLEGIWSWITGLISCYTAVRLTYLIPQFLNPQKDLTTTRRLLEQDALTGIANRRGLEQTVAALASQPQPSEVADHSLLIIGAAPQEIQAVTEEICKAIQDISLQGLPALAYPLVSASIGVTRLELDQPLGISYQKADQALYQAKDNGKNQVILHTGSAPKPLNPSWHGTLPSS